VKPSRSQLPALTGIRFFLAIWVVIYHVTPVSDQRVVDWFPAAPHALYSLIRTGYVAVGVFFVLSGFVLAYNYNLGKRWDGRSLARFAVARFSRVYPAYCIGLLLIMPFIVYRLARAFSLEALRLEALTGFLNWTLLQAWIPDMALTWNDPGWSLSNEAFFYLCFPFVGVFLWRASTLGKNLAAGAAMWLCAVLVPLWQLLRPGAGFEDISTLGASLGGSADTIGRFIKYNPLLRLPEFCVGILLCRMYSHVRQSNQRLLGRGFWFYLPALLLTGALLSTASGLSPFLLHNGILLPLYACLIFGLALEGGFLGRVLSSDILVLLGNASYSMYILHVPIRIWIDVVLRRLFAYESSGPVWVFAYTTTVIVLSCLCFKLIEEPLHRALKKKMGGKADRWILERAARRVSDSPV
jgi:peptidoglycan/LPS O-acetylase OafA/YrhL